LGVERLGSRSITLRVTCDGTGSDAGQRRVSIKQVLVTTSQQTHQSIDIPDDLRAAIERFNESP
ncbi:MAG: hypothetical protein J0H09_18430, partial [Burkholderiales bacterium]|nr:hypothetical protein [Burkholderiales bacterium]